MNTRMDSMSTELEYHVVSKDAWAGHEEFDNQLSVIEFLRCVRALERLPLNVTARGLDDLLRSANDSGTACDYIHEVLTGGVNHLNREQPVSASLSMTSSTGMGR